ncbi:MAG: hypothetical protein ACLTDR_00625 [Adlercreutzia equolifaciens]
MSDEKEVAQKLEEALRRYGADYGFVVTDKSVRKLIDGSASATVEVKDCTPKKLAEAFMEVGKVIEQSDDGMECVAVVGAGVANMNIALVVTKMGKDKVEFAATANEGLIKQNTANTRLIESRNAFYWLVLAKCELQLFLIGEHLLRLSLSFEQYELKFSQMACYAALIL